MVELGERNRGLSKEMPPITFNPWSVQTMTFLGIYYHYHWFTLGAGTSGGSGEQRDFSGAVFKPHPLGFGTQDTKEASLCSGLGVELNG